MSIHYNLLDESLLVNELLFTRLSRSYESYSTFQQLFDEIKYSVRRRMRRKTNRCWARQKAVDIFLSTISEIIFETRNEWFNYRVSLHFSFSFFVHEIMKLLVILNNIVTVVLWHVRLRTHYPGKKRRADLRITLSAHIWWQLFRDFRSQLRALTEHWYTLRWMAIVNRCLNFNITELTDAILQSKDKFDITLWFVKIDRSSYVDSEDCVNDSKFFRTDDLYTYNTELWDRSVESAFVTFEAWLFLKKRRYIAWIEAVSWNGREFQSIDWHANRID